MDSKCSGQEHLVKSLVGIENIPSKLGSYSYGTFSPEKLIFIIEQCFLWWLWDAITRKLNLGK